MAKTTIIYNNRMRESYIDNFSTAGFTADAGFPVENLQYDNPNQILKSSANPTTTLTIVVNFHDAHQFWAFGIFAHTLMSGDETDPLYPTYAQIRFQYDSSYPSQSGSWVDVIPYTNLPWTWGDNVDLIYLAAQGYTGDRIRVQITGNASPLAPFTIGGLFMGQRYELPVEIAEAGFISTLRTELETTTVRRSRHIAGWSDRPIYDAQMSIEQAPKACVNQLNLIQRQNAGRIIGVKQTEQIDDSEPTTNPHFFGRITQHVNRPRIGFPTSMDIVTDMEGI